MDSTKKLPKLRSRLSQTRRNPSKIILKNPYIKTQEEIEDRRLRNWRKWLENREKTSEHLKSLTGRKSEDLLINSYEKIRPKIEIQNILEAAALSVLPDKSKDEINFWTTPVYLRNRRDPENPELAVSLTKKQLNHPRVLSRVFLPDLTQKEKCLNLAKTPRNTHSEYLQRKLKELSPQISKLNLKTRDVDRVAVEGKKIPEKPRIILKINGEEIIFYEDSRNLDQVRCSLSFSSKKGEECERSICLENNTFRDLIYEWQEVICDLPEQKQAGSKVFQFDRASGCILPGDFPIFFQLYNKESKNKSDIAHSTNR